MAAWATLCVVVVIAVVDTKQQASSIANSQEVIQQILTRSCQDNGNPLRAAVAQMIQDQIDQSKRPSLHQFFPQISRKRLNRLIHRANVQRRKEIRSIKPVNCYALYHSKGS